MYSVLNRKEDRFMDVVLLGHVVVAIGSILLVIGHWV
jgi:hypothetical protein